MQQRLPALCQVGMPILVVDDGNWPPLEFEAPAGAQVAVVRVHENSGKGAAFCIGAQAAFAAGYTHGVQLDADGQHQLEDACKMIEAARNEPDTLWSGFPVYAEGGPQARLYGRKITRWMIRMEAGLAQEDGLCGCRVYPLRRLMDVMPRVHGRRMTFDVEVIVRWIWGGGQIKSFPIHVSYPEDGVSSFRMVRDNVALAGMHTRLLAEKVWSVLRRMQ